MIKHPSPTCPACGTRAKYEPPHFHKPSLATGYLYCPACRKAWSLLAESQRLTHLLIKSAYQQDYATIQGELLPAIIRWRTLSPHQQALVVIELIKLHSQGKSIDLRQWGLLPLGGDGGVLWLRERN